MRQQRKKELKNKLWKIFSEYVRRKDADWRGYVACVTCGKRLLWNRGIQAGHWIHDKLDFDERNVHPQCRNCNYKYNKNVNTMYAIYMAEKYGYEAMKELRKYADAKGNDYSYEELTLLLQKYTPLVKNL